MYIISTSTAIRRSMHEKTPHLSWAFKSDNIGSKFNSNMTIISARVSMDFFNAEGHIMPSFSVWKKFD